MLACCRPPNSDSSFFVKIDETIGKIDSVEKEIILVGELNCNYLSSNQNNDNNCITLRSITETYQLSQLIKTPTRVSNSRASLIDVVFT